MFSVRHDSRMHARAAITRSLLTMSVLSITLSACGGGGGGGGGNDKPPPAPAAQETLFVPSNAWNGPDPADATMVDSNEFRRLYESGEITLSSPSGREAARTEQRRKIEEDRAFLESRTDLSAEVQALLAQARLATDLEAQPMATLPDGQKVTLLDLGTRIRKAADDYRRARDPANARAAYAISYSLLSDAAKAGLATPESLAQATIEDIAAAAARLDAALAASENLDNVRLDPDAPVQPQSTRGNNTAQKAGNGVDNSGACTPTGLARRYWFPLRSFVPPVKQQGSRGTCWAFAAVSAVETRERVQNDNAADLSEQFLVNKYKREWFENEFVDGGSGADALNAASDRNQALLSEGGWTYNQASSRPANAFDEGVAGTAASYSGACTGYTGFCSESAHQSPRSCTKVLGISFCGYNKVAFNGPGVSSGRVRLLWANGQTFNLNQYRALLSSGVSLIASFPVYEGIMAAPATGLVADYSMQRRDAAGNLVDGSYGGHLVQIIGFISNEEMRFPGAEPRKDLGGGYFIVRNSWGCAADGGYYYVPADYVSSRFSTIEVLDFDARRSQKWHDDQVAPGGSTGLEVDPRGTTTVDLRSQANLSSNFNVTHPVASYVRLTVRSDRDGVLYDGQWMTNQPPGGSLFANSLPVAFQTEGLRTLTITARYGSQVKSATKQVFAVNSPPVIRFQSSGTPQEGELFVLNAIVTDKNDADVAPLCTSMTWTATAPDAIVAGTGCSRTVRFGIAGAREIRVATQDPEGVAASAIAAFNVAPPPANPYPRITKFGLYSRDRINRGELFIGCVDNQVPNQATVDTRLLGCSLFLPSTRSKFVGALELDNPLNETLTYDWMYATYQDGVLTPARSATYRTNAPSYDFVGFVFGARDAAYTCTLDVRVNAPEPSRTKTLRVWSGRCINTEDAPR